MSRSFRCVTPCKLACDLRAARVEAGSRSGATPSCADRAQMKMWSSLRGTHSIESAQPTTDSPSHATLKGHGHDLRMLGWRALTSFATSAEHVTRKPSTKTEMASPPAVDQKRAVGYEGAPQKVARAQGSSGPPPPPPLSLSQSLSISLNLSQSSLNLLSISCSSATISKRTPLLNSNGLERTRSLRCTRNSL